MSFRASHLVVPAYLVFTLLLTWPSAARLGGAVPAVFSATDPCIQSFILGWDFKAFATRPLDIFNAPHFHPFPRTLTYMDHLIGEALVAWPVFAATGRIAAAYNVLMILAAVTSGWGVYRLVRYLGLSRAAGFLSGFLFVVSPYRFSNLGLLNQSQTQFLPWGLFFALRYLDLPRIRHLAGTAAVLVAQAWFGWYYAFYLGLALLLLLFWRLAEGRPAGGRGHAPPAILILIASVALILPGVWPYLEQQRSLPEFRRTLGMTLLFSADLFDYIKLNPENWLARAVPAIGSAQGYWPGFVSVALALLAVQALGRRKDETVTVSGPGSSRWISVRLWGRIRTYLRRLTRRWGAPGYFTALAGAAFLFSLGPLLQIGGVRLMVPLPYALAYFTVPGFTSLRAPCRFAVLVALGCAVLAGYGYQSLARGRARRGPPYPGRKTPRREPAFLVAALVLAAVTAWSAPLPLTPVPSAREMPPVYRWLASQPGDFAILELPMPRIEADETPLDALRQLYVVYHGKRRLDGVSGYVPPRVEVLRHVMQGFPRPGTLHAASSLDARYIIFHYGDLEASTRTAVRRAAEESPGLSAVATFGNDVVYEIRAGMAR